MLQTINNKIKTLLGFALKSNGIIFGLDNIKTTKQKIKLIITCNTLSENSTKKIQETAISKNIKTIHLNQIKLEDIIQKENVKIVGITNSSLANEILRQSVLNKDNYKII